MTVRVALFVLALAIVVTGSDEARSVQAGGDDFRVIDGDTLQVEGDVVQLYGIDAPELGQLCESSGHLWPCGMEAALALKKLVTMNRSSLRCSPWSSAADPAASATHVCEIGSEDLAVLMLHNGNSLALSGAFPDYADAERQAREAGLGIWHSDFVAPWEWRAGVHSSDRQSDATRECNVKGVVDADGRRLYFVPTDPEYRALTLDPEHGERIFCSDDEARLAGWRRSGETGAADQARE